jgi:hypothetical protein
MVYITEQYDAVLLVIPFLQMEPEVFHCGSDKNILDIFLIVHRKVPILKKDKRNDNIQDYDCDK